MQQVRDHPRRPPAAQRLVLWCLALRLDFSTAQGFASSATLAADADVSEWTVRRATRWARSAGLLVMVQRGHRRGDGSVSASEWRISTGRGRPVEDLNSARETGTANLNRAGEASQPGATDAPSLSTPSLSKLSVVAVAEVLRLTGQTITETDALRGIRIKLDGKHPRYPASYLKKIIADDPRWWLPTQTPPSWKDVQREYAT